ncbi:MAG: erythromycin esterase family protein [Streptosporangiaceae bacterium]
MRTSRGRLSAVVVACAVTTLVAYPAGVADAAPVDNAGERSAVTTWLRHHAHPANSLPSGVPSPALRPVRAVVDDAVVVGLGAAAEGARELGTSAQGVTRYLVQTKGFRSIAIEDDWTAGVLLNRYLRTDDGNLRDLVAHMAPRFRTPQMLRLVHWVRRYNRTHPEALRFVGIDATSTRALAYDAVIDYVRKAAPDRLADLRADYGPITPHTDNIWDYNDYFYNEVRDKEKYVRLAEKGYRLVKELPVDHGSEGYRLALHNAYTIMAYYTFAARHPRGYRDQLMAHNLVWWRHRTGDKIVALSAIVHTAVDQDLGLSYPPRPLRTMKTAGAYLRDRYGHRYVSIGFTFGHGAVTSGIATGRPRRYAVPPPSDGEVGHVLGRTRWRCYLLDLDEAALPVVRKWLNGPTEIRVINIGSYDPARSGEYFMGDGSLRQWFDAVIHTRRVTASRLLGHPR